MIPQELLGLIRSLLDYHRVCGIDQYPLNPDIAAFLSSPKPAPVARVGSPDQNLVGEQTIEPGRHQAPATGAAYLPGATGELTERIRNCTSCRLHQTRRISTPGRGGGAVRLLIVGDWLTHDTPNQVLGQEVFGVEEDGMVTRMIQAMALSSTEVFVTNVIKCSIPQACQPTDEHIATCSSHLFDQLQVLNPEIICSMGIIATRFFTGSNLPLSQQRGSFFEFTDPTGKQYQLMPTFHPVFLGKNPELKKAVWGDLQQIVKRLGR